MDGFVLKFLIDEPFIAIVAKLKNFNLTYHAYKLDII